MGEKFETPPKVGTNIDENGNVVFTPAEFSELMIWLERFKDFVANNYD
jgi:hypothetical protein